MSPLGTLLHGSPVSPNHLEILRDKRGEHRSGRNGLENQQVPYEESNRVPFAVRYDPLVTAPRTDPSLITNIDLAPTFTALAGVAAPGAGYAFACGYAPGGR